MRSRILFLLTLLAMLASSAPLLAQWQQTSGPAGGHVSSFVNTGRGWLAVIGQGLYRYENNSWAEIAPQWYGQLFKKGSTVLSAHVAYAKVSTNNGDTWSDTRLPSDFVMIHGDQFISKSTDSLFRSSDGVNWEFYARTPESSSGLVEHKGKFFVSSSATGLLVSTDLGVTWTPLSAQPPFQLSIQWYSSDDALYALPYPGGLFRTSDEGKTWEDMHYNLDEHSVFEGIAANGTDIFASDWLTTYRLVGKQWIPAPIAKVHTSSVFNGSLVMATDAGLVEYGDERFRTLDRGIYSPNVYSFGSVGNAIFARTATGLYRSNDKGETWHLNSTMFASRMATAKGSIVVLGTSVVRSTDQGDTWLSLEAALKDFLVSPTDLISSGDDLYLTSALVSAGEHGSQTQWTTGGIYRSTDGGATWRDISGNLPENMWTKVPVYSVAAANGKLVIYTADGLFVSTAGSSNWRRISAPEVAYAIDVYSTDNGFLMVADSTWYQSNDGEQFSLLTATAPADFMHNYEYVNHYSLIRGVPYVSTMYYIKVDSNYVAQFRNLKLENNAWQDITATLPANTSTSVFIEHQGDLYAGTATLGVWKMGLSSSGIASNANAEMPTLYPNPAQDYVKLPRAPKSIGLFNALGQDVTSQITIDAATLDVRALPLGVYQITIDGEHASFVKQ